MRTGKEKNQLNKINFFNRLNVLFGKNDIICFLDDIINDEKNESIYNYKSKKNKHVIIYDFTNNFNTFDYKIISMFKINILVLLLKVKAFYYLHFKKVSSKNIIAFNSFKNFKKELIFTLNVFKAEKRKQLKTM